MNNWKIKIHLQPKHFRHKRSCYFQRSKHCIFIRVKRLFIHLIEI